MFSTTAQEFAALHQTAIEKTLDKHFQTLVQQLDAKMEEAKGHMLRGQVVSSVLLYVDLPGVSYENAKLLAQRLIDALLVEGFSAIRKVTEACEDGPGRSSPAMVHVEVRLA